MTSDRRYLRGSIARIEYYDTRSARKAVNFVRDRTKHGVCSAHVGTPSPLGSRHDEESIARGDATDVAGLRVSADGCKAFPPTVGTPCPWLENVGSSRGPFSRVCPDRSGRVQPMPESSSVAMRETENVEVTALSITAGVTSRTPADGDLDVCVTVKSRLGWSPLQEGLSPALVPFLRRLRRKHAHGGGRRGV